MSKLETADILLLSQIDDLLMFSDDEQDKLDDVETGDVLTFRSILYPDEV